MSSINPMADANWEGSAGQYDAFEKKWHYYARVAERLLAPLEIKPGSRALELASGTGACTSLLSRLCGDGEVVSVERSPAMVAMARGNMEASGLENVAFVNGDVAHLSALVAGMERFDYAVCNSAFWQFPEPEAVARAVAGALKPGGRFAFNIPALVSFRRERGALRATVNGILEKHGIDSRKFWRVRRRLDFRAILEGAGLEVLRDTHYYVGMTAAQGREWRRIPVFSRRWGNYSSLPPEVSAEVLEAVRKARPRDRDRRSRWRMIVAGRSSGRRPLSVK